jgi:hypothetical protein
VLVRDDGDRMNFSDLTSSLRSHIAAEKRAAARTPERGRLLGGCSESPE